MPNRATITAEEAAAATVKAIEVVIRVVKTIMFAAEMMIDSRFKSSSWSHSLPFQVNFREVFGLVSGLSRGAYSCARGAAAASDL